jgi:hypothetical protein
MQVEVEKTGAERGRYLHPVELGHPEETGIKYIQIPPIDKAELNAAVQAK